MVRSRDPSRPTGAARKSAAPVPARTAGSIPVSVPETSGRHTRRLRRVTTIACLVTALGAVNGTAAGAEPAPAGERDPESAATGSGKVEEIIVRAARDRGFGAQVDTVDSANVIGIEALQRSQSQDVFDVLRDVPGVSVEGGPRTSGKVFSIRGFSSNEDVLVQVDGVSQNFEKYRYGSGVDIEPELLKEVTVYRGGTAITQGSGYIGGMIRMETKDASDFLAPGERFGAYAKSGFRTNNDGQAYSATLYGRPAAFADTLFSVTKRQTQDYELPDGSRFEDSAESQLSALGKLELSHDDLVLTVSQRFGEDSGREPFDVTGGASGIGGTVLRDTEELATSIRLSWDPGSELINAGATVGYIEKSVVDASSAIAGVDTFGNPIGEDTFNYAIWTVDAGNVFEFSLGPSTHRLDVGVQGQRERRESIRENEDGRAVNASQPSGEKRYLATYVEHEINWRWFTARGGLRRDWYTITPGHEVRALLDARSLEDEIRFSRTTPGFALSFEHGPFSVFYNWRESFRAPLLDEYFARGSFSRCFEFSAFTREPARPRLLLPSAPAVGPPPVVPARPPQPVRSDFPPGFAGNLAFSTALLNWASDLADWEIAFAEWETAFAAWQAPLLAFAEASQTATSEFNAAFAEFEDAFAAYEQDPAAQFNAMCGANYEPETAVTREAGFAVEWDGLLTRDDFAFFKLSYFDVRASNILESIYENAASGVVSQPGREVRNGFEIEVKYERERWFADFNLSTLDGYIEYNFFNDNIDPSVAAFGDPGRTPLFNVPGDSFVFTLGFRPWWNVEVGHRLRATGARRVTVGLIPGCPGALFTNPVCNDIGMQDGYITSNYFLSWQPRDWIDLRLTVDNALNKEFQTNGFGGAIGATAPGRDVRMSVSLRY